MKSLVKVGVFATLCLIVLGVLIWKIEDLNPFGQGAASARRLRLGRRARRQGLGAHRRRPGRPGGRRRPRRHQGRVTCCWKAAAAHRRHHGEDRQPRPAGREVRRDDPRPAGRAAAARRRRARSARRRRASTTRWRRSTTSAPRSSRSPASSPAATSAAASTACSADVQLDQRRDPACWSPRTAPTSRSSVATSTPLTAILARELPRLAAQTNRTLDQISTLVPENRGNVSGTWGTSAS